MGRIDPTWIGVGLLAVAVVVYALSNPQRNNFYNQFVWQAQAFLEGRFAIPWPVEQGVHVNSYFQDVWPAPGQPGLALLPFPPLPAIILMPFVLLFGLGTDAATVAVFLGALNVALAWRLSLRLTDRVGPALLATLFYAFGTVAWYAAMLGSTWFFAHVVASTFLLLAVTLALDGELREKLRLLPTRPAPPGLRVPPPARRAATLVSGLRGRGPVDPLQFAAGLLFGVAALSRLTVLFGAPFFVFVGAGGSFRRRALSAGLGAAIPFALLLGYNVAATGHLFHPGYDYLYQTEYTPRPELRHLDWAIEDPRYIPQNAVIMLAWPPEIGTPAGCEFSLVDRECAVVRPDKLGMSVLLTSPGYLLALPLVAAGWRRRIVAGAVLAVVAIALVDLMHFSQGWVQFGYRFSNDFAPFALVPVTLAIARLGIRPLTVGLVTASILINAWGVYWGVTLGW